MASLFHHKVFENSNFQIMLESHNNEIRLLWFNSNFWSEIIVLLCHSGIQLQRVEDNLAMNSLPAKQNENKVLFFINKSQNCLWVVLWWDSSIRHIQRSLDYTRLIMTRYWVHSNQMPMSTKKPVFVLKKRTLISKKSSYFTSVHISRERSVL